MSLISIFLTWRQLFLVVLMIILIVGFSIFFITDQTLGNQYDLIGEHVLLSASLLLVWVMATVLKRMETVLQHQRETIKKLEKYQGATEILSNDEFKSRVKLIAKATDRRGAKNMVIEFSVSTVKTTEKAMHAYIAETILKTIRQEYDLVTKTDQQHYIVFLQDTNEIGVEKVTERLFQTIRHHLNEIKLPVTYKYYEATNYDFDLLAPREGDPS